MQNYLGVRKYPSDDVFVQNNYTPGKICWRCCWFVSAEVFQTMHVRLAFSISPIAAAPSAAMQFRSRNMRVLEQLLASASEICRTASSPTNLSAKLATSVDTSLKTLSSNDLAQTAMCFPQLPSGCVVLQCRVYAPASNARDLVQDSIRPKTMIMLYVELICSSVSWVQRLENSKRPGTPLVPNVPLSIPRSPHLRPRQGKAERRVACHKGAHLTQPLGIMMARNTICAALLLCTCGAQVCAANDVSVGRDQT